VGSAAEEAWVSAAWSAPEVILSSLYITEPSSSDMSVRGEHTTWEHPSWGPPVEFAAGTQCECYEFFKYTDDAEVHRNAGTLDDTSLARWLNGVNIC
jgi:hypothetical protein